MPPVKLLMTWDILPGQEQAYLDFNAREFVPRLMKLGLQPMDSWYTLYGDVPQVMVGWVADDIELARRVIRGAEWSELQDALKHYVANFRYKIVPVTGTFQL